MSSEQKQYFISCAVIFNNDRKVLLTKRHNPSNEEVHDKWQLPGGGIDYGEHPRVSVIREVTEETGLTISLISAQPYAYSHVFKTTGAHIVMMIYAADHVSGEVDISADLEETSDFGWFSLDEILKLDSLPETTQIVQDAFSLKYHD